MGTNFHNYLDKLLLVANAQVQQTNQQQPVNWTVFLPLLSAVASSIITASLTGFFFKRADERREKKRENEKKLTAYENENLELKKDKELAEIRTENAREIQAKDFEISQNSLNSERVKNKLEDRIRSLEREKKSELDAKELKINKLENDNETIRFMTPKFLNETYSDLKQFTEVINEDLRSNISSLTKEIKEKNRKIEVLKRKHAAEELIKIESVRKEELELREKIFKRYLSTFSALQDRTQRAKIAESWVELNRQSIIKSTVKHVIEKCNQETETSVLEQDIDDYLDWIKWSLGRGYPISLEEIHLKPRVSGHLLSEAFQFIKKERISRELTDSSADEINLFINELIAYFSSPAFRK